MEQPDDYITVKEAARRIGYSLRQTDRFIQQEELDAVHVNASLRKVSVASVDAFNARHGRRPVDPLEPIKDTLHQQEHVAGDILRQIALLRTEVEERFTALHKRLAVQEEHLRLLKGQLQHEREARQAFEQAVTALAAPVMGGTQEHQLLPEQVRQFLAHVSRAPGRRQSPQERRGYSSNTIRLVHFAAMHGIEPSTLRQHAEKTSGLATIYERPTATTKKHEWWLLPEQQAPLLRYWTAQNKPWTPCPDCPHEHEESWSEEQSEGGTAVNASAEAGRMEQNPDISAGRIPRA